MNKAHRIVWNAVTGTWTAVAEIAKGRSKGTGRAALTVIATVVALGALPGTVAAAEDCTTADGKAGTTDAAGACVVPSTTGKLLGASLLGASDSTVINIYGIGTSPVAKNTGDVAIGSETVADSSGGASDHAATAVGYGARAVGARTVALGMYANASATDALAFGYKGTASAAGAVAIGAGSSASGTNSVALGFGSVANRANTVSVGSTTATRQIVNVAAGSEETDAVNVKQLKDVGIKLDSSGYVTNTFVAYDDMTKGSATLGGTSGTTLKNVKAGEVSVSSSDAVNGSQLYTTNESVDKNTKDISTLKTAITNIDSGSIGLVQQDATSHAITVASATAGTTVDFTGTAGARQLKGVSKGTADTDAVNVAQLNDVDTRAQDGISGLNGDMTSVKDGITGLNGDMASVKDGINGLNGDMASVKDGVNGLNGEMASVKDGIDGINGSITSITNQITSGELGLVQQDATTRNLTVAANTDGATVDFTGTAGTRQLKGVSAGADDTDAVNVAQMKDVDTRAQDGISGLNGDMASVKDGVNGLNGEMASVKDGIDGINGSITSITNQITSGELGLVQQDATTRNLTVAANTDGAAVDFTGTAGTRQLKGVSAGADDTDAVNVAQMKDVDTRAQDGISGLNGDMASVKDGINGLNGDMASVKDGVNGLNGEMASVKDGIDGINGSITSITNQITSGELGLVQQDATSQAITVASATAGRTVDFTGTAGTRQLKGVSAGADDTDAVNVAQMKDVDTRAQDGINGLNGDMASVKDGVNGLNGDMASVKDGINGLNGEMASVKDGIDGINGSITSITNQINNGELGLVQQDQTTRDLTVASDKDGAHVNFAGTAGSRELIGVAAGTTSNSAVNVGQLSPVVASLGGDAQVNADGSVTGPTYHVQGGTQNTVGGALNSLDNGLSTLQTQINNGSIGMVTQNQTSRDILVGAATDGLRVNMAGTAGNRVVTGVAAGAVNASSSDAVNGAQLHTNAKSTADALGGGSTVNEDGTISMPTYNVGGTTVNGVGAAITNIDGRVTQNTSDIASLQTTVGTMSGSVANAVSYDSAAHNQVTLGGSASAPKVKLTNLQDGELSATSSDAVTGSQLWNTNQQVANLNQAVQNQQSTGSSSIATDTGGPAASATGSGSMAMGGGAQASGDNSVALGAGSVADQANTVSVGSPGNERRITNVADGQGPTDAVNMRQFQQGIGSVARNAYSGVAAATALTMIPDVDPGKTIAVGIGTGNYKGYQAVSLGMSARITQNLKIKAGAGMSSADTTYGVGAAYQW
ncbi:Head domain of trimeric autotransporter adhesin [Burkholderia sp. GAS332]|nr:Head domain of trimeric autotransporter adhesin [Burkholderia sp. GAS332]